MSLISHRVGTQLEAISTFTSEPTLLSFAEFFCKAPDGMKHVSRCRFPPTSRCRQGVWTGLILMVVLDINCADLCSLSFTRTCMAPPCVETFFESINDSTLWYRKELRDAVFKPGGGKIFWKISWLECFLRLFIVYHVYLIQWAFQYVGVIIDLIL